MYFRNQGYNVLYFRILYFAILCFTILSFTICNNHATTDTTVDVYIKDSSNSDKFYYLYKTLSLPAKSTFEHTAKVILDDNDDLYYDPVASVQIEAVCSYLKQTQENK